MRSDFEAVVVELRRLRASGVEHIYLEDETIELLDGLLKKTTDNPSKTRGKVESKENRKEYSQEDLDVPIPDSLDIKLPHENKLENWNYLRNIVLNCKVCRHHVKPGKKVVFGVGNLDANIFFCGEAPGADEETIGEPFVGKAGQLLTRIIGAMGLQRNQVYITNIMNWRPATESGFGNRPPDQEEMRFCLPYLRAQLEIVQPKVIVALGNTAVGGLLGPDPNRRMGSVRGKWFEYVGVPLVATYHPSYVLRNNLKETKRLIWCDMLQVMKRIGMQVSEVQKGYFQNRD
ncbi:MAG: Type-4 uracil-DNA glycosylase [Candidatus Moanabacter tarae]|uniref:Type-4 uracil-DNA glycosylase n=1 Tax=Candidatus Moanibacter tarae TaxID=2200854 RepID=A0A2Z4AHH6_9BACT|nr:MAG: Type-4 uracil-DNA glycosylase [Candidatus Moanabacter tarae]|tara:strand:- start:1774 stop:2640 length:867 start_codon:yes stop_codon:yes gene_type:complete